MNKLTLWEVIAMYINMMFVAMMCVTLLGTLDKVHALWVIPMGCVVIWFIASTMFNLNQLRVNQTKVKDYNELRKAIVVTKFDMHAVAPDEQYILVSCDKRIKNMNTKYCRDCTHGKPHVHNDECDEIGCISVVNVMG